ncbi:MAG: DUF1080 domain-containing protein [Methanoregulaceae archaeon]|nr:DUF1080 domain-containing protein [Methanoregulaceae archaeon]
MMLASLLALTVLQGPERPRDIWAFRSVLDDRARMLTLALHTDLWVAYDATNCGLYRAWKGGVKFDGAVYTSAHGPQPTSIGAPLIPGIVDAPVWSLSGKSVEPEFKGYRFERGGVILQYRVRREGLRDLWIEEQPEVVADADGSLRLSRQFRVRERRGQKLTLRMLAPEGGISDPTKFEVKGTKTVAGHTFQEGLLNLGDLTTITIKVHGLETGGLRSVGARVGGADGAAPSQEIPLDTAEEETTPRGPSSQPEPESVLPQGPPREAGVSLRVYWIGADLSSIPRLMAGQTPNTSKVIPNIDLKSNADFGSPEPDQFYAKLSGFLNITEPGDYAFRLSSDDGSKFSIRDEVIVNHDGLHGAEEGKEGKFRLSAGEHPFEIEFFESGGGEELKLEWMPPGKTEFVVIPASVFTTPAGEVRVTAPGRKAVFDPNRRYRPGDGVPLTGVHPSFDLETVRPADFKPRVGGMDFLPDGRLVVCTWDPDGAVYILDGVRDPKPNNIKVKRIAAGLAEPLGLKVVRGQIYVLQKQELTLLKDKNGDEIIDEYFAVANGWGVTSNFHEFAFGLVNEGDKFYANLATAIDPGGKSTSPQNPERGHVLEIDAKTGDYKLIASGLRTPNGIGRGFKNRIFITDNQGDWLPASKLLVFQPGAFYGNRSVDPVGKKDTTEMPPVVWLSQNEIGNSPSQPTSLNAGPYLGQMIHGDVTHGGVKRVYVEEVEGVLQGSVFRFTQGLEAGVNRLVWGPDGALYIGGIGSTGNWGQEGKERFGLQRLSFNKKPTFEMLAVRAMTNGMEIEFTEQLAPGAGSSVEDYTIQQWRYVPTVEYGGPKVDERALTAKSATVSSDRRRVFLEIEGLKEGHVVYLRLNRGLPSASGRDLWTTEAWYTLNKIPLNRLGKPTAPPMPNTLTAEEKQLGFEMIFDGTSTDNFRGFRQETLPGIWKVVDGALTRTAGAYGGDIVTKEQYDNFEVRFEWRVAPGGNSGVFYRVSEDQEVVWYTGPEYQILDDDLHPDGRSTLTSAASIYGIKARAVDVVRPGGRWNETRIIVNGDRIEHWLNNVKVVEMRIGSEEWNKLVAEAKFATKPTYGKIPKGHLAFQDHGDVVSYRTIRIRKLGP